MDISIFSKNLGGIFITEEFYNCIFQNFWVIRRDEEACFFMGYIFRKDSDIACDHWKCKTVGKGNDS